MKAFIQLLLFVSSWINAEAQYSHKNKQLKFSMKEPPGWIRTFVGEPSFLNYPDYRERIISFQRYTPNKLGNINPTIDVTVEHFGSNSTRFMKRYLKPKYWMGYGHGISEFILPPQQVIINGKIAIACIMQGKYKGHGQNDNINYIRKRAYYMHVDKHIFKITFTDDGQKEIYTTLFDTLKNSIRIEQL